ncbi:class I SAM-dependent methyltransferase [Streptomyces sp. NBC_01268]|uniref:class I SAM-dependent DNA methyltransferase n=1 Tax=unclassified Streptomyces TaxID=2593676 RepID=UPI002E368278|nr:class I SAM-dependent methyltransferase [Streptomyces sp. NBC_01268]
MIESARVAATRASYDAVAASYERLLADELAGKPWDRGMLAAFAEEVRVRGAGPVGDLGCGTGRVTRHLRRLGTDVFGLDLSPGMIAVARESHPELRFEVGSMTALDLADGSLGGVLSWYSTVHLPTAELCDAFAEFRRVLVPGGPLLVAFKAGDGQVRLERAYGHEVDLDVYRHPVERVTSLLTDTGFSVTARLVRGPDPDEATPQGFLLAHRAD